MQFANPIWLWALSGLAIPIGIHLLSRKEGKVIYIGSLRHLDESNTKQFRALKLNEIVLLILRCILIMVTVLLLAGLHLQRTPATVSKWLVIEPGIQKDPAIVSLTDSLIVAGYKKHFLTSDFPIEEDTTSGNTKNYWALIDQLTSQGIHDIVVISHTHLKDFTGERIPLPSMIKWITVDSNPKESIILAQRYTADSAVVRLAKSNAAETSYDYQRIGIIPGQESITVQSETATLHSVDTVHVTVAYDKAFEFDAKIIAASLKAIQKIPATALSFNLTPTENFQYTSPADWIIWLSEKQLPPKDTCHTLAYKYSAASSSILVQSGSQIPYQHWVLMKRLNVDNALQQHITTRLASIILHNKTIDDAVTRADQRNLPEAFLNTFPEKHSTLGSVMHSSSLDQYLFILIVLLVFIERLLTYHRNQ